MPSFFVNRYYNTYYYANFISNILSRDVELLGFIDNFFCGEQVIPYIARPFNKVTAFHIFIQSILLDFFVNDMDEYDQRVFGYYKSNNGELDSLYAENTLGEYGLNDYSFKEYIGDKAKLEYADIERYHEELMLTGRLEELCEKISHEIFYLMFNNREALLSFNYIVAEHMAIDLDEIDADNAKKLFNRRGYLKRAKIPEWCKK